MSAIGFDSCFYERLDEYSRSLNRVLIAEGSPAFATDEDWRLTLELVQTLATHKTQSLAASSVVASLSAQTKDKELWQQVANVVASRSLDPSSRKQLNDLAWSLDDERTAVLARMRNA